MGKFLFSFMEKWDGDILLKKYFRLDTELKKGKFCEVLIWQLAGVICLFEDKRSLIAQSN